MSGVVREVRRSSLLCMCLRSLILLAALAVGVCSGGEIYGTVESSVGIRISTAKVAFVGIGRASKGKYITTSKDGSFVIRDMPAGLYWAQASVKGYRTVITGPVRVIDSARAFVGLVLTPAGPFDILISDVSTVSGIVCSSSGPLAGAVVCGQKSSDTPSSRACVETDNLGFYGLVVGVGVWRITVEEAGRAIWRGSVDLKNESEVIQHIVVGK